MPDLSAWQYILIGVSIWAVAAIACCWAFSRKDRLDDDATYGREDL